MVAWLSHHSFIGQILANPISKICHPYQLPNLLSHNPMFCLYTRSRPRDQITSKKYIVACGRFMDCRRHCPIHIRESPHLHMSMILIYNPLVWSFLQVLNNADKYLPLCVSRRRHQLTYNSY